MTPVNLEIYKAAIVTLLACAFQDTSGSRSAAQVLLSAYNGHDYPLNVPDLGLLDDKFYFAAVVVIRGRTELRMEPNEVVDNGGRVFGELAQKWQMLHLANRYE